MVDGYARTTDAGTVHLGGTFEQVTVRLGVLHALRDRGVEVDHHRGLERVVALQA